VKVVHDMQASAKNNEDDNWLTVWSQIDKWRVTVAMWEQWSRWNRRSTLWTDELCV